MENATTFRKDDRDAAGSRFARADELHTSHDQRIAGEILRLLRAHVTPSSSAASWTCSGRGDTCSCRDSISYT
ncbi:hypothetical protein Scep_026583 [Stephania cephalantha]|uniref:Uncharacterized protein n=1 Tax=Stephania cephalantha TaxID=152367 RepID=A0AAP0HQJ9_9MAGN